VKDISSENICVVIPAKNEAESLETVLVSVRRILPEGEIIVINDGSDDKTPDIADRLADITINHPHSLGNGASVKAGARAAKRDILVFMDADGQHDPNDIPVLLNEFSKGHTMVVGARKPSTHANIMRRLANFIYNRLATYMTGQCIKDLTSGFRVVRADEFKSFLYLLPNGFSYPTTITMALSRTGLPIHYVEINAMKREKKGRKSHIKPLRDGIRFLIIIFRISALYSPLKIFAPAAFLCFATGLSYYLYTYITDGRFTNMGLLLFITALLIFLIGLVSEQITTLMYANNRIGNDKSNI
jgi:glycosyltransferase involved in cell wall biosynthesis